MNVSSALSSSGIPASLQELKVTDLEILPDVEEIPQMLKLPVVEKFPSAEDICQNAEGKLTAS